MPDFSLILPTRERPGPVQRLFQSLLDTTSDPDSLEIVLYVDDDDPESARIEHPSLNLVKLIGPRVSMGEMTRACYRASHGKFIVLINDDAVIRTQDWDLAVKDAFARRPDGIAMAYPNDLYYGEKVSTFPILSRAACEAMGEIVPAEYRRHCIDSHLQDIFERLEKSGFKRATYLPQVIFEHLQYGLSFEAGSAGENPAIQEDRARYWELAEARQKIAERLADHIRSSGPAASSGSMQAGQKPRASIILTVEEERLSAGGPRSVDASLAEALGGSDVIEILALPDSGDRLPDFLRRLKHKIRIHPRKGMNEIQALQAAAASARGDYLVFLDASAQPQQGWLEALMRAAEDESVGVVGSKWINPRNGRIEHAGLGFYRDEAGALRVSRIYRGFKRNDPAVNKRRPFQAVERTGMLVKRDSFMRAGGFSPEFPGLEYIDLCLKISLSRERERAGERAEVRAKALYAPDAALYYSDPRPAPSAADQDKLFSHWGKTIEADLFSLLSEDGFVLQSNNGSYSIRPASEAPSCQPTSS